MIVTNTTQLKNKKLLLLALIFLFGGNALTAQIIDNKKGKAFREEMYFNQQFLWLNKIKTISGIVSIKRTGRPIEQKPDVIVYRFNQVGLLHKLDKVSSVMHLVDSLTIEFKRNDLGDISIREENGSRGFYSTQMNYDSEGRLVRVDYSKAENTSTEKGKLVPANSILINSETYQWNSSTKGVIRKSAFNNYGLNYSNITITTNEFDCLVSEVEELVMSGKTTTRTYYYNDHGWIDKIETNDSSTGKMKKEKFYYDPLGNLLKADYFENDKLTREIEVLYTKNMLIEAYLDHDIQSNDILITKFSYEFY